MDLTLSGLIATMVVFVIIFAMLGLIFDITLRVLNQQKLYSEFYSEAQRITNIIDLLLSQSVWTDKISVNGNSLTLDFFVPSGSFVVKQSKVLKIENSAIIFDGKKITDISNVVKEIKFTLLETENIIGNNTGRKYIKIEILSSFEIPKTDKEKQPLSYSVPVMTALSEGN